MADQLSEQTFDSNNCFLKTHICTVFDLKCLILDGCFFLVTCQFGVRVVAVTVIVSDAVFKAFRGEIFHILEVLHIV